MMYVLLLVLCLFVATLGAQQRLRPLSSRFKVRETMRPPSLSSINSSGGDPNNTLMDSLSMGTILLISSVSFLFCLCVEYTRRARRRYRNRHGVAGDGIVWRETTFFLLMLSDKIIKACLYNLIL